MYFQFRTSNPNNNKANMENENYTLKIKMIRLCFNRKE